MEYLFRLCLQKRKAIGNEWDKVLGETIKSKLKGR